MPNKENITKWIEELRSGEYEQGKGMLRSGNDKYCCLGVACELASKEGIVNWHQRSEMTDPYYVIKESGVEEGGILPTSVANWLGVTLNPLIDGKSATQMNDTEGASFEEIADAVERTYLNDN